MARLTDEVDLPGLLKVNLFDPHCRFIIYGGVLDDATQKLLSENQLATEKGRVMLLETSFGAPRPMPLLHKLHRVSLREIFRDVPHRPKMIRPKPAISRNAHGQRIDPPLRPIESVVMWLRPQKFCNEHYLRGECLDHRCRSRHDLRLDSEQLEALQYVARGLPCRNSNHCRDPDCYAGHLCPIPTCRQQHCRFYAEMHIKDRTIVSQDP